ncbi:MAG: Fic family protein [Candidatus Gracilibacteria bacterium]
MASQITYDTLRLLKPDFDSPLIEQIIHLEKLRSKSITGSSHPKIFFQLKNIFHTMESIGSARIEGNRTTIAAYIESKISPPKDPSEDIQEIANIEKALEFIETNIENYPLGRMFISEIHKIVVSGLSKEGSSTPGDYRSGNVIITGSGHTPPDYTQVRALMDELFAFTENKDSEKYDLLKIAISHHRFAWVHPFDNGNGRTVRMFTYALLMKYGFNVHIGQRLINPTAVFCNDRDRYYEALSFADSGSDQGILAWCEYVLSGLSEEIEKLDKLLDYGFLRDKILLPAITNAHEYRQITDKEKLILDLVAKKQVIEAKDVKSLFPDLHETGISRYIRDLKEKKLLIPESGENSRKYLIGFGNSALLRGIIYVLRKEGFITLEESPNI